MKRLVLLILALAAAPLQAQTPAGWPNFKQTFRAFVESDSIVGASALLVKDGRILDRLDLGFADRARGVRVDSTTIYHWGSITKTLTAISVMQLRDRGKLSLDDRVVDYVPELRAIHDPFGKIDSVTIRMLLSHSAGFQNGTWPYSKGRPWEPFEPTTWNQLVAMMPYQEISFKPGTRFSYSNPGFIYLARIIESLTGDPWESYVQKNIFAPIGLTQSYFRATPYYLAAHRSHNYSAVPDTATKTIRITDNGADFDPGITVPNGGWNATASEVARYISVLIGNNPDVLISRNTLEEMWRPVIAPMGLSFFVYGEGSARVIGHTGHQAEFGAFVYFNPTTRYAIIAAYNTSNYDPAVLAKEMEAKVNRAAIELLH